MADSAFRKNVDDLLSDDGERRRRRPGFSNILCSHLELRRVFQPRIHVERSAPDLLRRARQRGWDQLKAASDLGVPVAAVGCSTSKVTFAR